jgi:hypothetical protein
LSVSSAASSLQKLTIEPIDDSTEFEIPPVAPLGPLLLHLLRLEYLRVPVEALFNADGMPCPDPRDVLPVNFGAIEITDPAPGIVEWGELLLSCRRDGMFLKLHTLVFEQLHAEESLVTASFKDAPVWSSLAEAGVSVQWLRRSVGR